mmetsp:Transcript_30792/g.74488  ORF Transcript_30792/g.74488 Transcript_30792/m.74488 type:complete len:221 (+) Transcript_30792:222-884(+)|eukprot:CAMPEP_0113465170 /NCGR_PEP_ID=MMETSP0014_2-20120614/13595_1 /TAXON_ID=2857 /ORGANISM="Nitzschia sp." /LENGTH=220 /DNA_ID=CAMNT_0000357307 /DNA_START=215 /DNA_END=877 /DNA_ORIENTATION=+ /assembly_acc=CAM_ASM_000159
MIVNTQSVLSLLLVLLTVSGVTNGFVVPGTQTQSRLLQVQSKQAGGSGGRPTTTSASTTTRLFDSSVDSLMGKLVDTSGAIGGGGGMSFDDPMVMAGAAAVLVIGGIAAAAIASGGAGNDYSTGSKAAGKEPEPEPIDVSIPYDAAAVVSYKALKGQAFSKKEYDQIVPTSDFKTFLKEYKDITVEEIALKMETKKFEEKKSQFQEKKSQFLEAYSSSSK